MTSPDDTHQEPQADTRSVPATILEHQSERLVASVNPVTSGRAAGREATERGRHAVARLVLVAVLLGLAFYLLSNYLRALIWAVVLAIAIWPVFNAARRKAPGWSLETVLPGAFTLIVAIVLLLPFLGLAVEGLREADDIVAYGKSVQQTGIPVPVMVEHLPYGRDAVSQWWNAHLAHSGWIKDVTQWVNTSSNRELGRAVGANAVHRVVLFGFCLLTLFFLLRDGGSVIRQVRTASDKLLGSRGERIGEQMVASIHGTVSGLVLVGIGEGALIGIIYYFTGVPHPVLFGAFTSVAAMIPFVSAIAIGLAALVLISNGAIVPAVIVIGGGFLVTFIADHFVRPSLIGGTTKLPFLWVLLGVLGGVETFGLLGLFVGPAIMAALVLLWREYTERGQDREHSVPGSGSRTHSAGVDGQLRSGTQGALE